MKRTSQEISPTHTKIIQLLQSLEIQEEVQKDPIKLQLQSFRQKILNNQQYIQEKFNSLNISLNEMERDNTSSINHKQLRIFISHEDSMTQKCSQSIESLGYVERLTKDRHRQLEGKKTLKKMKLVESDELFKSKLKTCQREIKDGIGAFQNQLKLADNSNFSDYQLKLKIQALKRESLGVSSQTQIQQNFLQKQKHIEHLIRKEQELLNKNFTMHCETLQKLVLSISEKII